MKLDIDRNTLLKVITKGSIPALSKMAQEDGTSSGILIKSLTMTANDCLTVESSTEEMSVKYFIPKSEDMNIQENGSVTVPAKELVDWVNAQSTDAKITILFQKLSKPEVVDVSDLTNPSDDESEAKSLIKKIGVIKLGSKSPGTSRKWELDVFDSSERSMIDFNNKGKKNFDINVKKFSEYISKIAFAAQDKDYQHVIDSASIQYYKNKLYFISTDSKRCALYKIPDDVVNNVNFAKSILIPHSLLSVICKNLDEDNIMSIYYNENINKVFISQPNLDIRVRCPSEEDASTFPNVKGLIDKEYKNIADIRRSDLLADLISASIVNGSSAFFDFDSGKEKDGFLTIKAKSESGKYNSSTSKSKTQNLNKSIRAIWSIEHLIEALGVIKSEIINISSPDTSRRSIRMIGKDDENFIFYSMGIANNLYDSEMGATKE